MSLRAPAAAPHPSQQQRRTSATPEALLPKASRTIPQYSTVPPSALKKKSVFTSPPIQEAIDRVEALGSAYARAVQRVLARGKVTAELLILPVDTAHERTTKLRSAFERGEASEKDLLEALGALARLMEMVISEGG